MQTPTVEKWLEEERERYFERVRLVAARVREEVVIPFCDKHELIFDPKLPYYFRTPYFQLVQPRPFCEGELLENGPRGRIIRGAKGLWDKLHTDVPLSEFSLGKFMEDYCPPAFEGCQLVE
jgi:hypothetical protein